MSLEELLKERIREELRKCGKDCTIFKSRRFLADAINEWFLTYRQDLKLEMDALIRVVAWCFIHWYNLREWLEERKAEKP